MKARLAFPFVARRAGLQVTEVCITLLWARTDRRGADVEIGDPDFGGKVKNKIQFASKTLKSGSFCVRSENMHRIKALDNNKLPYGILLKEKEALGPSVRRSWTTPRMRRGRSFR